MLSLVDFTSSGRAASSRGLLLALLVLATTQATATSSPREVQSQAALEKTHMLFLGADLAVKHADIWWTVEGTDGKSFLARTDGATQSIPMDAPDFEFTLDHDLKVSANSADIDGLATEKTYSPVTDPLRRWVADRALAASSVDASVNAATTRLQGAIAQAAQRDAILNNPNTTPQGALAVSQQSGAELAQAQFDFDAALIQAQSQQLDPGWFDRRIQEKTSEDPGFDAVEFVFTVSPRKSMTDPWVVVFVEFTLIENEVPLRQHRVFAEPIGPLAAGEKKDIRFTRAGFPQGFQIDHTRVHLFEGDREIATNLSERRTPLTWDETNQFLVLDHIVRHRDNETDASAALIHSLLSPSQRQQIADDGAAYFIRVSPDGAGLGVFVDLACTQPVGDTALVEWVSALPFFPAVSRGKAVEGVVLVRINTAG